MMEVESLEDPSLRDILAVMIASMDFEEIFHKRRIGPLFRDITETPVFLEILSRMYNIPQRKSFSETVVEYDKKHLSPRALVGRKATAQRERRLIRNALAHSLNP